MNTYEKQQAFRRCIVEAASALKLAACSQYMFICDLETGEIVTMSLQTRGVHEDARPAR